MKKANLIGAVAAAFVVSLSLGAPATAATLFSDQVGHYSEKLHNDQSPSGTTVTLKSQPTGDLVDLIGNSFLNPGGNGNGFATVNGPFLNVLIDPQDPLLGFTKIGFTLNPQEEFNTVKLRNHSFKIDLTFVGSALTQTLSPVTFTSNKKFDIWSDVSDPGAIATVKIYALSGFTKNGNNQVLREGLVFNDIRQISYERFVAPGGGGGGGNAIPEPATWAMMILGFGAAGSMLRRRRAALA